MQFYCVKWNKIYNYSIYQWKCKSENGITNLVPTCFTTFLLLKISWSEKYRSHLSSIGNGYCSVQQFGAKTFELTNSQNPHLVALYSRTLFSKRTQISNTTLCISFKLRSLDSQRDGKYWRSHSKIFGSSVNASWNLLEYIHTLPTKSRRCLWYERIFGARLFVQYFLLLVFSTLKNNVSSHVTIGMMANIAADYRNQIQSSLEPRKPDLYDFSGRIHDYWDNATFFSSRFTKNLKLRRHERVKVQKRTMRLAKLRSEKLSILRTLIQQRIIRVFLAFFISWTRFPNKVTHFLFPFR